MPFFDKPGSHAMDPPALNNHAKTRKSSWRMLCIAYLFSPSHSLRTPGTNDLNSYKHANTLLAEGPRNRIILITMYYAYNSRYLSRAF